MDLPSEATPRREEVSPEGPASDSPSAPPQILMRMFRPACRLGGGRRRPIAAAVDTSAVITLRWRWSSAMNSPSAASSRAANVAAATSGIGIGRRSRQ